MKCMDGSYNLLLEPTMIDTENKDNWWWWLNVNPGLLSSQFDEVWAMIATTQYRQISNISRTELQTLDVSCIALQLS